MINVVGRDTSLGDEPRGRIFRDVDGALEGVDNVMCSQFVATSELEPFPQMERLVLTIVGDLPARCCVTDNMAEVAKP